MIGNYSRIGMNSIVTAGVTQGPRAIVAIGAAVTKIISYDICILAGVFAKVENNLGKDKFGP